MKFIIALLLGAVTSFFITKSFYQKQVTAKVDLPVKDTTQSAPVWNWSDTIDAVQVAPASHQIVYEDTAVRILRVSLAPNSTEPLHTHRWKSIMWFTQATPMTYYQYALKGNNYEIKDSFSIPQMPAEVLGHGDAVDAEGPHAIKNTGKEEGIAYRVEFKK